MSTYQELQKQYVKLYPEYFNNSDYFYASHDEYILICKPTEEISFDTIQNDYVETSSAVTKVLAFHKINPEDKIVFDEEDNNELEIYNVYKTTERPFYEDLYFCEEYSGIYYEWYSTGEKKLQGTLFNGKKNGLWLTKTQTGIIMCKKEYLEDELIKEIYYFPDGKPKSEITYKPGKIRHGLYKEYVNTEEYFTVMYDEGKVIDLECFERCVEKCNQYIENNKKDVLYGVIKGTPLIVLFEKTELVPNVGVTDKDKAQYKSQNVTPLLIFNKFNPDQELSMYGLTCKLGTVMNEILCYKNIEPAFSYELTSLNFTGNFKGYTDTGTCTDKFKINKEVFEKLQDGFVLDESIGKVIDMFGLNTSDSIGMTRVMKSLFGDIGETIKEMQKNDSSNNELNLLDLTQKLTKNIIKDEQRLKNLTSNLNMASISEQISTRFGNFNVLLPNANQSNGQSVDTRTENSTNMRIEEVMTELRTRYTRESDSDEDN